MIHLYQKYCVTPKRNKRYKEEMLLQLLQCLTDSLSGSTILYVATALLVLLGSGLTIAIQSSNASTIRRQLKHLRLQGIKASMSNMADQYDAQYAIQEDMKATDQPILIKSIYIHPIKSCGPIELDQALLTKTGFMYDRCFALATETDSGPSTEWRFISQRTKPTMSLIQTQLWLPDRSSNPDDALVQAGGCLLVTFPDPDLEYRPLSWFDQLDAFVHKGQTANPTPDISFIVPLNPTPSQISAYDIGLKTFGIHARAAQGLNISQIPSIATALPKLKRFLRIPASKPLALLKCTPDTLLPTTKNLAPLEHIGSRAVHGYTDQQPININSLSSVHAVSALLPRENQPLNALRFRANIWVTGTVAYDEEEWKRYRIVPRKRDSQRPVSPTLSVVCRTSRCTMPNVNPDTGEFDTDTAPAGRKRGKPQPSTTLVDHRTVEISNAAALGYLGMHCVPEDAGLKEAERRGIGLVVSVGDEIEVMDRGVHVYGSTGDDY